MLRDPPPRLSHGGYGEMVVERERVGGRREEEEEKRKGERGPFIWSHPRYLPKIDGPSLLPFLPWTRSLVGASA